MLSSGEFSDFLIFILRNIWGFVYLPVSLCRKMGDNFEFYNYAESIYTNTCTYNLYTHIYKMSSIRCYSLYL